MADRIELPAELREFLLDPSALPTEIFVDQNRYTPDHPVAAGYKGVVWKVTDRFGRARALKLAILEDYQDRSYLEEIQRTAKLEGHEVFARLENAGTVTLDVPGHTGRTFIGFVEEWIDGVTLEEFLEDSVSDVSPSFMVSYIAALTSAFSGLQANLKLAILEDYQDRSYLEEIQRTAKLEGHEVFARHISMKRRHSDAGCSGTYRTHLYRIRRRMDRPDQNEYWGLGPSHEREIRDFIYSRLQSNSAFRMQGVSLLRQTLDAIEREMFKTHSQMIRGTSISSTLPATFLGDLTTLMCRLMPRFQEKKIAFLVDDYSTHRLPSPVQHVLNRVIWERRPSHIFKLSSEKYGAELMDPSGALAELAREMVEIDCGREYLALDDSRNVASGYLFAVELLDNRLERAGYVGTAEGLIGRSSWPEGNLAKALVGKLQGRQDHYHGLDCVAAVCSGDVSTLLLIYRKMFEGAGVDKDTTRQISKAVQHRAIRTVSRDMLNTVKNYFPDGPAMYDVVSSFGRLARAILEQGTHQKKGDTTVPSECPRIEIDQPHGDFEGLLSGAQQDLKEELIRRAIFIDMEPGLSRHGNATTLRWQLRRVYLPAFGASLAKNNAVKENPDWLQFFLSNPVGACQMVLDKWPRVKTGTYSQANQLRLMGIDGLDEAE